MVAHRHASTSQDTTNAALRHIAGRDIEVRLRTSMGQRRRQSTAYRASARRGRAEGDNAASDVGRVMWNKPDDEDLFATTVLVHPEKGFLGKTITQPVFWNWYATIQAAGIDMAHQMAVYSASFVNGDLSEAERERLRDMLEAIQFHGSHVKNIEEQTLGTSYQMLQQGEWSREQARKFASNTLGKPIDYDAWRMQVNRWAKAKRLPPLGKPRKRKD